MGTLYRGGIPFAKGSETGPHYGAGKVITNSDPGTKIKITYSNKVWIVMTISGATMCEMDIYDYTENKAVNNTTEIYTLPCYVERQTDSQLAIYVPQEFVVLNGSVTVAQPDIVYQAANIIENQHVARNVHYDLNFEGSSYYRDENDVERYSTYACVEWPFSSSSDISMPVWLQQYSSQSDWQKYTVLIYAVKVYGVGDHDSGNALELQPVGPQNSMITTIAHQVASDSDPAWGCMTIAMNNIKNYTAYSIDWGGSATTPGIQKAKVVNGVMTSTGFGDEEILARIWQYPYVTGVTITHN